MENLLLLIMSLVRQIAFHLVPNKDMAQKCVQQLHKYLSSDLEDCYKEELYNLDFTSIWKCQKSNLLSSFCRILAGIRIHSAATEGTFSQVGFIKTKLRNRLGTQSSLNEICVCKSYVRNEKQKIFPPKQQVKNIKLNWKKY